MKQNATRTAPFAAQDKQDTAQPQGEQQMSPASVQLRESFDEIGNLKTQLEKSAAFIDDLTKQRDLAIARVVLLERNGATAGLQTALHPDGSMTLPITLNADIMPSIRAQYEAGEVGGMTLEEFVRDQIVLPALECYQGNM